MDTIIFAVIVIVIVGTFSVQNAAVRLERKKSRTRSNRIVRGLVNNKSWLRMGSESHE